MVTGVYQIRFSINLAFLKGLYATMAEIAGKRGARKFRANIKELEEEPFYDRRDLLNRFYAALHDLTGFEQCPAILKEWRDYHFPSVLIEKSLKIFSPILLSDKNDVAHIERVFLPERDYLVPKIEELPHLYFNAVSIKKTGVSELLKCLKEIPHLETCLEVIGRIRQTFSSRFTFRPYPLAVRLWLKQVAFSKVPRDLRDFLEGAVSYHESEEWRTSIVLSAIAVESLLADLYEDHFHQFAPKKATLGDLFSEVKKKNIFPDNITEGILMANEARISAVHRSRYVVSDREATNALYGATTFIMWYYP